MADATPGEIRWRCRRGMKELDLMLAGWFALRWSVADASQRQDFSRLLDESDPQLADWLLGGSRPEDARLAALVDDIVHGRD